MTTKDEALQMAITALEYYELNDLHWDKADKAAITACREALAQKDEQEPVAVYVGESLSGSVVRLYDDLPLETPLYTAPPKRQPLTDVQISHIWDKHIAPVFGKNGINPVVFARAIERAILEKSNG